MSNKIQRLLRSGQPAFGAQLRLGCPAIAELFSLAGFDWLSIDSEHAPQTPVGIQLQLQAMAAGGATPIVRVPKNDPDLIRLYLDMGAQGVLVPFIETPADAEAAVRACRYPPRGIRGFGPARAYQYGLDSSYFARADDQILFIPIIESAKAIENIEAIFAVDGVETCMIGPADLSLSLGVPLLTQHAKVQQAMQKVVSAARSAGKWAGTALWGDASDPANIRKHIDQGFGLLLLGGDEWLLAAACQRISAAMKQARANRST
ncbi:HpcH/HpaI aldolase family protein [Fontivita pretiosa]|uniref:HpcH/HpaI aldolase family protein n=1 Tax=Fontivita pretiosa TaxID=2989684 RepID=UPI003D183066